MNLLSLVHGMTKKNKQTPSITSLNQYSSHLFKGKISRALDLGLLGWFTPDVKKCAEQKYCE